MSHQAGLRVGGAREGVGSLVARFREAWRRLREEEWRNYRRDCFHGPGNREGYGGR